MAGIVAEVNVQKLPLSWGRLKHCLQVTNFSASEWADGHKVKYQ
uniref:Uncharacterized protein n=1 Tax=Anguilla anguilla TaxID=7936 RepID=A0A0E9WGW4_ANGAN